MTDRVAGQRTPQEEIERIIRVNQAGEYGAVQIYKGQLSVLKDSSVAPILHHMLDQEKEHLSRFNHQMLKRRVRPTVLSPLWHVAGYALGKATALMGKRAAMACTVAVEEVIDDHYQSQEVYLSEKPEEKELKDLVTQCREEELEHRDIGYDHGAEQALGYPILTKAVKTASRLAIFLSKRV